MCHGTKGQNNFQAEIYFVCTFLRKTDFFFLQNSCMIKGLYIPNWFRFSNIYNSNDHKAISCPCLHHETCNIPVHENEYTQCIYFWVICKSKTFSVLPVLLLYSLWLYHLYLGLYCFAMDFIYKSSKKVKMMMRICLNILQVVQLCTEKWIFIMM